MKILIKTLILSLLLLTMCGCAMQNTPEKKPQQQQDGTQEQVHTDPELAEQVKETASMVESVKDSTAVVVNNNISAAIKVTGFDRLRLKPIRKEVYDKITKIAPEYEVHVTTDKKLFAEIQKIEMQIKNIPAKKSLTSIKSKVDKINKDMKG